AIGIGLEQALSAACLLRRPLEVLNDLLTEAALLRREPHARLLVHGTPPVPKLSHQGSKSPTPILSLDDALARFGAKPWAHFAPRTGHPSVSGRRPSRGVAHP